MNILNVLGYLALVISVVMFLVSLYNFLRIRFTKSVEPPLPEIIPGKVWILKKTDGDEKHKEGLSLSKVKIMKNEEGNVEYQVLDTAYMITNRKKSELHFRQLYEPYLEV